MKIKKVAAFIFPLLLCSSIFCEPVNFNFSFTPEFGFLNGKIVENVWNAAVTRTNTTIVYTPTTKMSQLDWQLNNTPYFGAASDFIFNNKYSFLFSFKNALARDCGIMEDYDWLNPIKWPKDPPDELTNYSKHTNHLNSYTLIDFTFGRIFFLDKKNNISITPRAGFEVETISFSGIGGWKTYKSDNWVVIPFNDTKVISYSQTYVGPILMINADFNFARFFETSVDLSALWSEKMNCIDKHHERNALFNDRIQNLFKLGAEAAVFYKINQNNKLGIKAGVTYIPESYGFTYGSETSTTPDQETMGGTNRFFWNYSLVYSIIF